MVFLLSFLSFNVLSSEANQKELHRASLKKREIPDEQELSHQASLTKKTS